MARTALIADSHLGGPGGAAEPMIRQLQALPEQGCDRLVLMGDIFQAWVGFSHFETPEIAAVVPVLRRLREGGLPVYYIEGNRDFFIDQGPYADAIDAVLGELAFEAAGKRVLAVHGDGLNDADWQYRFWRWLSKSTPARFGFEHFPRRLAQRLVHTTEARLSKTNFKHKKEIPEAVIRAYAEHRLAEGHDLLVLGHFHEERRWQAPSGEIHLLEAWYTSRRVEWLGG